MSDFSSCICSFVPDSVRQIPFEFVKRQFIYFFRHERRASDLKERIEKLKTVRDRMESEVGVATGNEEDVHEDVRDWLDIALRVTSDEKAKELEKARERAKARCFVGLCPNLWFRRQLCKMAIAELETVNLLLKDYPNAPMFQGKVALPRPRPPLKAVMGYTLDEDIMTFESRANTCEGIMKALKDPDVPRVGVCGMGGIGKTILIKQVGQRAMDEHIFDEIAFAPVTKEPKKEEIQGKIAAALRLRLTKETVEDRASELSDELNKRKRILIILDDIWEELCLLEIGIPFKDSKNLDGNKILMTSRMQGTLRLMKSVSNFEVAPLPFPEAKSLFTKIIRAVPMEGDYESIVDEVTERCAGSPIAIAAVAKAFLAHPSMDVWEDVRNELKSPISNRSMEGVQQGVYASLEISYKMLKDKKAERLFLLLGMFPQGASIGADVLLRYGVGLDLFDGVGTYHESRSRVNALLHKLRASSLLLKGDDNDTVKLHDLVRDVAANIANSDPYNMFRIEGKSDFKRLSKNGKLSHATGLFILPGSELPEVLECPKLVFLHIRDKEESFIYARLFKQTTELKVLDVKNMKELKSLPASLLSLTSLQSLCVDWCRGIRNISNIGKLQHLLVLRIRGSHIEELPEDLKQLRDLQLLDLSYCSELKVIPENLFSSLTKLEELYMGDSFNRWGVGGNASVSELLNLSSLTVLHIHIPQAETIPEGMPFEKLTAYNIVIGHAYLPWDCNYEKSRKLMIFNPGVSIRLNPNAKKLLATTEELRLDELKGVRNVLYELDSHGFLHLKKLRVGSSSLQYLVNFEGNRFSNGKAFPDLESLSIMDSDDLEMVCHGQPKAEALMRLRSIKISGCDALTRLFPLSMAKYLLQLERINIGGCENLITIFDMGMVDSNEASETTGGIELSKLRSVTLRNLPKFVGFCTQDQQMQPLFNERILPYMSDTMSSRMSHGLISLTNLTIDKCGHLKYLFSFSVVRTLGQLQRLEVCGCESIEMIVLGEETNPGNEFGAKLSFPQLKFLKLQRLENLIGFCSKNYDTDFPSLETVELSKCHQLEAFFSMHDITLQPHFIDKILLPYTPDTTSSRMSHGLISLTSLTVDNCGHLKYLFSFSVMRTLEQLQLLKVRRCKSMEMIVLGEETNPGSEFGAKLAECHQLEAVFSTHDVTVQAHSIDKRLLPHTPDTIPSRMSYGLKSLTSLTIYQCGHLKYLFSFSIARTLEQLQQMEVSNCSSMEMIVLGDETSLDSDFGAKLSLPRLNFLKLECMENLRGFCSKNYDIDFPSLKTVELSECHQLEVFFSTHDISLQPHFNDKAYFTQILNKNLEDITQFQCLKHLDFTSCDNLKYLFNHSMAFNLVLLEILYVESCKMMKEIITEGITTPNQNETVIFPRLKELSILDCPNLINFCAGKQALKFPSLEQLTINKCPNVLSFYSTSIEREDGPSNCTSPSFFTDKVVLPNLSKLVMADFDNVVTIFSSNIVHRFLGIWELTIRDCGALEMVYEMQGLFAKEHSANGVAQLRDLNIIDLPKLRCIWSEDPQGVAFQNLSKVFAWKCENLRYLFPPSVAQGLSQLEKLKICHCGVEEVVAVDKDEQQVMRFAFPQLSLFILLALPKLKFFCAKQHTIEWPMLKFAQSDDIEGLCKVLRNTPMQSIGRGISFWNLIFM